MDNTPKYMISTVAALFDLHPQTLRTYERIGLVIPKRSKGNTRLYSENDLETIQRILTLTRDMGINLAGVEVVLKLQDKISLMQEEFYRFVQTMRDAMEKIDKKVANELEHLMISVSLKHINMNGKPDTEN